MVTSANKVKFNDIDETSKKQANFSKGNTNNKNVYKRAPAVHVVLDGVEFNCALISQKIQIKDVYLIFPFRWESIIFQSHSCLSADFVFFLFEGREEVVETLRGKLDAIVEEGMVEFKNNLSRIFKNVSYFDYLYFMNSKPRLDKESREKQEKRIIKPIAPPKKDGEAVYPDYLLEIASCNATYLSKIDEDQD
jgi:hypothetical protein